MKFEIKHRFSGAVMFEAEIEATEDTLLSIKVGLAVRRAIKSSADLSSADLSYADLRYADLSSADLRYANLRSADLSSADLRSADLSSADLRYADLSSADLRYADLRYADLRSANLSSADLRSANLRSADLSSADLSSADLRYAKNLSDFTMADGLMFSAYKELVVPALLTAGGKTLDEIKAAGSWSCHSWTNCPMAIAFSVDKIEDIPPLYRHRAQEFIQFFDGGLIPAPWETASSDAITNQEP